MKKQNLKSIIVAVVAIASFSSCTTMHKTMREPFTRVEFQKDDFILSEQVSAQASSTKVFSIDWSRIITSESADLKGTGQLLKLASIPVVGNYLPDRTANYALYELMEQNPGYDVVFYPQYETKVSRPF